MGNKQSTSYQTLEMTTKMEEGNVKESAVLEKKALTFWELFRVLKPYFWPDAGTDGAIINRIRAASTWFLVSASKACSLCAPFYIANATNSLLSGDWRSAMMDMIIFCVLRLSTNILKELQSIVYIKVKQQASIELQEFTFAHLHCLSLNWHLSKKTGTVIKSMDRGTEAANQLITYLFLYLVPAFAECMAVVILFFAKFQLWSLGVVVFCGVALYSIATIAITQWRKKFREATNKHDNDFHDKATDSIINFETVKYFTAETFEVSRFRSSVVNYQHYNASTQLSLSLLNISQQVILVTTLLATMILSGQAVIRGDMTIGDWVAVQSWVTSIFIPLNFLGSVYAMIIQAFVDIRNLSELLSESPDIVDQPDATTMPRHHAVSGASDSSVGVSVEFQDVSFNYPEQLQARGLKHVSFKVAAGTTTAIVGHTGSGKTTISRLLFRFYDPREGCVAINGHDIKSHTQKSVRDMIGIVPQDTVLFNDSILYNVRYGRQSASMQEIIAAAEAAQILTFIEQLPQKWETMVGERGLKLSGGEKQRVAIARCLLKDPPVVLLDEATSALDTVTEHSVQDALNALGKNRTVIIIAHRLSTIRQADQIIVMDEGALSESGDHEYLLEKDGIYAKLWNMQLRAPEAVMAMEVAEIENDKSIAEKIALLQ